MSRYSVGNGGSPSGRIRSLNGAARKEQASEVVSKSIGYVAEGTVSTQVLSISKTAASGASQTQTTPDPDRIEIENTGNIPVVALIGYETWGSATADGAVHYLQTLVNPGEVIQPPMRGIIPTADHGEVYDGTIVDFTTPTIYVDSGQLIDDAGFEAADTELTVDTGAMFRVNDLIQVGINTTTATRIEIMRVTGISSNTLTVERALFGTSAADKDAQTDATSGAVNNAKVYFPFFNEYHDHDQYTVPQTDAGGRFKAKNLYGYGRTTGATTYGITPGSLVLKYYNAGYQNITDDGDLNLSTNSGLTAGTTYYLSVSIDGGTTDKITFTVDSSNVSFGGVNGIVSKLQDAIDALYYNPAKNGYKKKAVVSIVNGNLRVTSGQRTAASAISITTNTDGTSGTDELFDGTNTIGRFPANIPSAVAASLPDDVIYDGITYSSSPNVSAFCYDDGKGNIRGKCSGTINYETGEIDIKSGPANAQFQISVVHSSPFSGKRDATEAARANSLVSVYANVQNKKMNGKLDVRVY